MPSEPDSVTASELLSSQREGLEVMLEMNARVQVDHVTRFALDTLDSEARGYLARIKTEQRLGPIGSATTAVFGENGYAPAIRDIIKSAARFRALGASKRRDAA